MTEAAKGAEGASEAAERSARLRRMFEVGAHPLRHTATGTVSSRQGCAVARLTFATRTGDAVRGFAAGRSLRPDRCRWFW